MGVSGQRHSPIAPTHSLHRHWMGVSGQRHSPATLYPREMTPSTRSIGGCLGHRASLDTVQRKSPLPLPGIELRSCSQTLCWLSYHCSGLVSQRSVEDEVFCKAHCQNRGRFSIASVAYACLFTTVDILCHWVLLTFGLLTSANILHNSEMNVKEISWQTNTMVRYKTPMKDDWQQLVWFKWWKHLPLPKTTERRHFSFQFLMQLCDCYQTLAS
jgi:hypothetical protein